jgi:group I intron endonuclease
MSGKSYIGQTVTSIEKRWYMHCRTNSCLALSSAIKKYGKDAFTIELLGSHKTIEDLNNAEEYFIDFHNSLSPNGYNIREGGGSGGALHEETKRKIGAANKNRKGHSQSEETKQKIREYQLGKPKGPFSKEHIEKLRLAKKGKPWTKARRDVQNDI